MAKISASLADVSTEFSPAGPGVYIFEVADVVEREKEGKISYQIKNKIVENISGDDDSVNKTVTDFISIHSKDGTINQYGLINLKRYFEAVLGKDELAARLETGNPDDEPDTDELKGKRFKGQIKIEHYWSTGAEQTEENKKYKNTFEAILPELG